MRLQFTAVRRHPRRTAILAIGLILAVITLTVPSYAADSDASLSATLLDDDLISITGKGFPETQRIAITTNIDGVETASETESSNIGRFAVAAELPSPTWSGVVEITAISGAVKANKKLKVRTDKGFFEGNSGSANTSFNADGVAASKLKVSKQNVKVGSDITASVTVQTNKSITFKEFAISVRDSKNVDVSTLDFDHDENLVVNGKKTVSHSRSFDHADKYKIDIAYTLDGEKWTRLVSPTTEITVTEAAGSTPTTEPSDRTTTTNKPSESNDDSDAAEDATPTPAGIKPGIPGNWRLVFNDEFNGNALDLKKWIMCNPSFASSCKPYNEEKQLFRTTAKNPNVKVSNGQLHLIATKEGNQIYSGMVSTGPDKFGYNQPGYKSFQFTYGYYEGRVKIPKGNGFWPSMWMLPDQDKHGAWPGSGEYDVFEIPGNDPTEYHFTSHWGGAGGVCGHPCTPQEAKIADASSQFHVFGLDWQPNGLTWYVDGKKMGNTVTDAGAIKNTPFYIIANFSVGGTWGPLKGGIDGSTPFPASMDIDYLRVWQH